MNEDLGKLILRLTLGILMLLHGIAKLKNGVSGIEGMLIGHGLPDFSPTACSSAKSSPRCW